MKKLTKKVVIATTTGLASMILNAACGYGPEVTGPAYNGNESTTSATVTEDNLSEDTNTQSSSSAASAGTSVEVTIESSGTGASASESASFEEVPGDAASIFDSLEDYLVDPELRDNELNIEIPDVYGPPTVDD